MGVQTLSRDNETSVHYGQIVVVIGSVVVSVFCSMVVVVSYGVEVDVHIGASVVVPLLAVNPDVVLGPVVAADVDGSVAGVIVLPVVVLLLPVDPDVVIGPVVAAAVYGSVAVVEPGIAVEATVDGA